MQRNEEERSTEPDVLMIPLMSVVRPKHSWNSVEWKGSPTWLRLYFADVIPSSWLGALSTLI